jgi:methyl-accepting chemotaxis protein
MNPRQLGVPFGVGLLLAAWLLSNLSSRFPPEALFFIYGVASAAAVVYVSYAQRGAGGARLDGLFEAVQAAAKGRRVRAPEDVPPDVSEIYDELGRVARRQSDLNDEIAKLSEEASGLDPSTLLTAIENAAAGQRIKAPPGARAAEAKLYAAIVELASAGGDSEEAERRADLAEARAKSAEAQLDELARAASSLETLLTQLSEGVIGVLEASASAGETVREANASLHEVSQAIEMLATSAEESSSSILEMTATNDEVAENVGELASSVRETVSSIEEMAYSIREVAKNVDALSLTAEETSSSMNEMDVSIDQVQSNANETARLSEEVASDAERGAEAILKTIGEIYRIKESSQEAVSVISNLGFRIEAIGQILAVIDDVAEQTNLLALNAAIIAAQAGEHGKGFAVVADEIKDLAERAGGSTKEIAELIKTIQSESKNAIAAVERGAHNVDRGVEVSNEAERALKKILESSQKSTNMVRAIARATVEQAKGSKQVTDAIGRIAETVQQIAAATAQQARGSELIMKSAEKMRTITQHVERSSQEQARGGRQITGAIEQISNMVNSLNSSQRAQTRGGEQLLDATRRIEESAKDQDHALRHLLTASEKLRHRRTAQQ